MPQKILEIKVADWTKGISAQANLPIGGLFQQLLGCDPFEQQGVALPCLTPPTISPATTPKVLTNFVNGLPYVYAQSDTKLYQILKDSPYTITDVTSNIATTTAALGATVWQNYYIYAAKISGSLALQSNPIPVGSGAGDVTIGVGFQSSLLDCIPFCAASNGLLYVGDYGRVQTITSATGTSGNSTFVTIDVGFVVRDLIWDGRYLVILADNNSVARSSLQIGSYRCKVYFWDTVSTQSGGTQISPVQMYDITDSYLIGGKYLGGIDAQGNGICYFFGYNGLYACSAAMAPVLIKPFVGSFALSPGKPMTPYQMAVNKGSIYWVDGSSNAALQGIVYAYGNPVTGGKKIFYTPYINGGNATQTALTAAGDQFWAANNSPIIYVHNVGSTRGQVSIRTTSMTILSTYTYEYTKVTLTQPLSSGQSVQVQALAQNGSVALSVETQSYNAANPKQTLLFKRTVSGVVGAVGDKFEDIQVYAIAMGGATIQRISTYATPLEDTNTMI